MPNRPPVHQPPGLARAKAREAKDRDRLRGSAAARGYGRRWQKARTAWLRANPLCVHCLREGHVVVANEVDHIVPHRGNRALFWDTTNWQSLCHTCHSAKTLAEQQAGRGRSKSWRSPSVDPRPRQISTVAFDNFEV
jgi:5-methylcytosine-specific restriction enzyme A